MRSFKSSLPIRVIRGRHDNAVWWWQQRRIKRAMESAFAANEPHQVDDELKLEGAWPDAKDPRPVVFAACDEGYFNRFGQHLALSSSARSPQTRCHLHIYEPSPICLKQVAALTAECEGRLTVSFEGPERNPFGRPMSFYFAAGRFAVASRMRKTITAPILMIDADGLVGNELQAGFEELAPEQCGFILQPENAALFRKILASAIYLGFPDPAVDDFFSRLADGMAAALKPAGLYHVDQIGIHFALQWCKRHHRGPKVHDLDLKWSDYKFRPESLIWSTKGARKGRYDALVAEVEGRRPVRAAA